MLSDSKKLNENERKKSGMAQKENYRGTSDPTSEEKKSRGVLTMSKSLDVRHEECNSNVKEKRVATVSEMEKESINQSDLQERTQRVVEHKNANESMELISWYKNGLRYVMRNKEFHYQFLQTEDKQVFVSQHYSIKIGPNDIFIGIRYFYEKLLLTTLQGYTCVVQDLLTNKRVAVKVANKMSIRQKRTLTGVYVAEDFLNEIAILNKISRCTIPHDGIVQIIGTWETDLQVYFAMEYCPGGSLFEYCTRVLFRDPGLKPTMVSAPTEWMKNNAANARFIIVQRIFSQMVSSVYFLHRLIGVCHRDISLENFVMTKSNSGILMPKLIDFGLARTFGSSSSSSIGSDNKEKEKKKFEYDECVGKMRYQSPECFNCRHKSLKSRYDGRLNDNYGLGICLFLLLFGRLPYQYPSAERDARFNEILRFGVMPFIETNKLQFLINKQTVNLLNHLITPEANRLFIEKIAAHPFFTPCALPSL